MRNMGLKEQVCREFEKAEETLKAAKELLTKGVFPQDFSRLLTRLRENREESDYGYAFMASREDTEERLLDAEKIIDGIKQWLKKEN